VLSRTKQIHLFRLYTTMDQVDAFIATKQLWITFILKNNPLFLSKVTHISMVKEINEAYIT